MMYIVIVSAAVFVIEQMDTTGSFMGLLSFSPGRILRGEVWRLITWIFCPLNDQLIFTALMLYFYYFIGSTLEREWGTAKFTVYYILGILLNIIYGFIVRFLTGGIMGIILDNTSWLVPNYLNLSMFFAFAVLFPDQIIRLFFVIPIKIKWLALFDAAYFIFAFVSGLLQGRVIQAVLPLVAILNFILICGNDALIYLRPLKARASRRTIDFKRAAKKARREQADKPYRHKCAVCGKTDAENPGLEFRYCSRCNGFHCFCIDHINNHVHFS